MRAYKIGDIVQFNTKCIWNKCSGIVHKVNWGVDNNVCVTLPDGKTKLAFGEHELILRG